MLLLVIAYAVVALFVFLLLFERGAFVSATVSSLAWFPFLVLFAVVNVVGPGSLRARLFGYAR